MSYFKLKLGLLGLGIAFMSVPSTAQAQNFTRKGVVAGAVIGAIAGSRNDRPLGGAVIGGLVGGVAGNAIDRSRQQRFHTGYRGYGHPVNNGFYGHPNRGFNQQRIYYAPQPVYRTRVHYGSGFNQPFYGGSRHVYRGW